MAVRDTKQKPFIEDRDDNIFIGIDLPFRKSDGKEGYFASTTTTIEAVKNNIKNLLKTTKGERLLQPNLGLNLKKYLFEQFTDDLKDKIAEDILETFKFWLPFVNVTNIEINMDDSDDNVGKNKMNIIVHFNIIKDPNTLESVLIEIGD